MKKNGYNTKITKIENKIPDFSDFDTNLRSIIKKVTSNKTREVYSETELRDKKSWININKGG